MENNLTRFDVGGKHETNPYGGIAQGQDAQGNMNTVEQGETKSGNFVYSDRISLDSAMIKQFNLPGYAANKSVSAASKAIEDKFKDRNDKYANETKKALLDRLANAQESVKAEQAQTQQAMQTNSQQAPEDMMQGQIPEGMEEFVQPQQSQPIAAYGGNQMKYFNGGYMQGDANLDGAVNPLDKPVDGESTAPSAGSIIGGVGTALELGQTAFGKASQDTSGTQASDRVGGVGMIGGAGLKGAAAGTAIMPGIGTAIGAGIGLLAGGLGLGKARKAEALNTQRFALNTNRGLSDNYAAYGGNLNIYKYADGGIINPPNKSLDVRKPGQALQLNSMYNSDEKNYIPYTKSLDGLQSKNLNSVEKNATTNFVNWYSDPKTKAKIEKAGWDPSRTTDIIAKGLRTPIKQYNESEVHKVPMGSQSNAEYRSPYTIRQTGDDTHPNSGYITYRQQSTPSQTQNVLGHELTHASGFDNILAPSLYRALGEKLPEKNHSGLNYMSRPEEVYGNFHEMRLNLGLKPGEKVDIESLKRRVKETNIPNNFWQNFSQNPQTGQEDDERINKIVKAVNTVAQTNGGTNTLNKNYAAYGGNLNVKQFADGGELPTFTTPQLQQTIGLQPGTWGPKSIAALKTWQKSNGLVADGVAGPATYKQAGLMDGNGRYQFKRPDIADTSNEVITAPINSISSDIPTQTLAGFEKYAEGKLPTTTNQKINNALKYVGENAGEALRYAPIAANLLQMKNLKKPTGVQYQTLGNRYKPSYVDEAQGRNIVDAEGNNTIAAISQSGASQGATRNAILGAGLNKTKALSDVYANASAQNRAQDMQAQQFNLNVDQSNVATANKAIDEMRMDQAAYEGAKSKGIANIGNAVGAIGKEQADAKLAKALTGYTRKGNYVYDAKGNPASAEITAAFLRMNQASTNGVVNPTTAAYGGYLNTRKKK